MSSARPPMRERGRIGPGGDAVNRVLGVFGSCAGAVLVVAALLPGAAVEPWFLVIPPIGLALLLPIAVIGNRLPDYFAEIAIDICVLLVAVAVLYGGALSAPMTLFFIWTTVFAFCYFPVRHAVGHAVLVVVAGAVVSWSQPAPLSYLVVVTGTTIAAGVWVRRLVVRIGAVGAAETARAKAEAANQAKTEFLSRMSHELRTPLNAVLGFAELLQIDNDLTPLQREAAESICAAGDHLLELINEVLEISRIEEGRAAMSIRPVDLQSLAGEALALVQPLATDRGINLPTSQGITGAVAADRQRLRQILINLLSNAVKYNRDQGEVTLTTREIKGMVEIAVSDQGEGLSPADIERLFAPFERLHAAQRSIEGTGLGLTLSRALAEGMGGSIAVSSDPGTGSVFTVTLPGAEVPAPATPADLPPTDQRHSKDLPLTLLVIEDNEDNRRLLAGILSGRPNVEVYNAEDGVSGLSLARRLRPDLILLDLHLPDIQGDEVLQKLQADPTTSASGVVIVSADASPGRISRLLAAGALAYLTKPLQIHAVLEVVDSVAADRDERKAARVRI